MRETCRVIRNGLSMALFVLVFLHANTSMASDGVSPYVGIYGGVAFPETFDDVKGRGAFSTIHFSDLNLKSGAMVGVKVGLTGPSGDKVARWFGLEVDGSYTQSKIEEQNVRVTGPGGSLGISIDETKVYLITGALHLLLKYPNGPFQPYAGVGPAVVHARISDSNLSTASSATSLGLSGVGGFRLMFSEHIGFFAEYKHIRAALEFDDIEGNAVVHAGVGGVNFAF